MTTQTYELLESERLRKEQERLYDSAVSEEFVKTAYRMEIQRLRKVVNCLTIVVAALTLAVIWIAVI